MKGSNTEAASVVSRKLLYDDPRVVILAPYRVRGELHRESRSKILDSGSSPE